MSQGQKKVRVTAGTHLQLGTFFIRPAFEAAILSTFVGAGAIEGTRFRMSVGRALAFFATAAVSAFLTEARLRQSQSTFFETRIDWRRSSNAAPAAPESRRLKTTTQVPAPYRGGNLCSYTHKSGSGGASVGQIDHRAAIKPKHRPCTDLSEATSSIGSHRAAKNFRTPS